MKELQARFGVSERRALRDLAVSIGLTPQRIASIEASVDVPAPAPVPAGRWQAMADPAVSAPGAHLFYREGG